MVEVRGANIVENQLLFSPTRHTTHSISCFFSFRLSVCRLVFYLRSAHGYPATNAPYEKESVQRRGTAGKGSLAGGGGAFRLCLDAITFTYSSDNRQKREGRQAHHRSSEVQKVWGREVSTPPARPFTDEFIHQLAPFLTSLGISRGSNPSRHTNRDVAQVRSQSIKTSNE